MINNKEDLRKGTSLII